MNRSLLLVLAGAVAVVVLFLVFRPGDDSSSSSTTTAPVTTSTQTTSTQTTSTQATSTAGRAERVVIAITVRNARPVGGIHHVEVEQGEKVSLVVTSDTPDEIHLHGYDLHDEVEGGQARIDFTARIAGRFEAELEEHGIQILDLEVRP